MMTYTLAQTRAFVHAIERRERSALAAQLTLLVTANRGSAEDVRRLSQQLGA